MALSDVELNLGAGGAKIGVDLIGETAYEVVKQAFGTAGSMTPVDADNPLPVTDAVLAGLPLDQASVTAGEKGILIQGATTTSAPAYSNGRTNPLSLTVLGALRTDSSATTQPVSNSGTFATQSTTATASGNTTMQNAVSTTGNGTSLTVTGYGVATVTLSGTWVGTVNFEASTDAGTTWSAISATLVGGSTISSTATANGIYRLAVAGIDLIRARVTWTSGTSITAIGRATNAMMSNKVIQLSSAQPTLTNALPVKYTEYQLYGTTTSMTVTNLNSVANSATVGWQSARVSNISTKAQDYQIGVKLTMANTLPANDKAVYVYLCAWYSTDGGTTWRASSQGTTTLPTGTEGASTIASPNNLRLLGVLNYTTQNMVLQDTFLMSNAFGSSLPEGFSIIIIDYTGAAISASGNEVYYTPINKQGL